MPEERSHDEKDLRAKLEAYDTKDYSEVIEFPVELVDRDGVVRRYSYEESLAVYHRRIQSATWRHADEAVIHAEIGHCTRRIDQIKRSFHLRSKAGSVRTVANPRSSLGEGYDVLRAFYAKVLLRRGLKLTDEPELHVTLLEDRPGCRVYHLAFREGSPGQLFYIFPFDRQGDQDPKEAWNEARRGYQHASSSQAERLLLSEERDTAGFILTGTEEIPSGVSVEPRQTREAASPGENVLGGLEDEFFHPWWLDALEQEEKKGGSNSFERGVAYLRDERSDLALECFQDSVGENPYHRESYLGLLGVLDLQGRHEEAKFYGEMATRHLPRDGLIRYRLAINLVRQGEFDAALVDFDEAARLSPGLFQPSFFAAHLLLARVRDLDGAAMRLRLASAMADGEEQVRRSLELVNGCLSLRRSLRLAAMLTTAVGALALPAGKMVLGSVALVGGLGGYLLADAFSALLARWLVRRVAISPPESDLDADKK